MLDAMFFVLGALVMSAGMMLGWSFSRADSKKSKDEDIYKAN